MVQECQRKYIDIVPLPPLVILVHCAQSLQLHAIFIQEIGINVVFEINQTYTSCGVHTHTSTQCIDRHSEKESPKNNKM